MTSRYVDWGNEENEEEKWVFTTRELLLEKYGYEDWDNDEEENSDEYEDNEDYPNGIDVDDGYPMYNYAYPIESGFNLSNDKILKINKETACCVVYNTEEDQYYLSLMGAGMNFSQDIALAYMIVYAEDDENYGFIDWNFLEDVYTSGPCSVSDYAYQKIIETLHRQLKIRMKNDKAEFDKFTGILEEIKKRRTV